MGLLVHSKYSKLLTLLLTFIMVISSFLTPSVHAEEAAPSDAPELTAPANLKVVSKTHNTVTIQWDQVPGVDPYATGYWVSPGGWASGVDPFVVRDLKPETEYTISVGVNVTGSPKSTVTVTTSKEGEVTPPAQAGPRNLRVVEVTHNTVSLAWDPAPGIKHYWIWNADNKYVFWANDGAQTVGGLTPETTYSFYVGPDGIQAPNLKPEEKSNTVTFTTYADTSAYPDPPLTPPSNLKIINVSKDAVILGWGASPLATGYDVYVNGAKTGEINHNEVTNAVYGPEGGYETGKSYVFEVAAHNPPNPASVNSNKVVITWGQLAAPQDIQVVTATRTTASIGWAPVPGATSYEVFQDNKLIGSTTDNRYLLNGLTEGKSYAVTVIAKNQLWQSAASSAITVVPGSNYNIVTYYIGWAVGDRQYLPTDMDVSQVTHVNYAFADLCWKAFSTNGNPCQSADVPLQEEYVHDGEIIVGDPEVDLNNYKALAEIRNQNPHLKILASVGGWSWSNNFSNMAATEITRRAFANSVVDFIRKYQLDGIDIDWEYPVEGGEDDNVHRPEDKQNFTLMAKAVREALDAAGSEDGKYYLQTIASGQGDNFTVNADFVNSVNYLDFVNIMTYDYSGGWETLAHHNSPLYYDKNHPRPIAARNNVEGGALGHLNGGVPKHKLVLGIPFYGNGWQGCPADGNGQYQTCESGATFGSWEGGKFDFADLEDNYINKNGYVSYWNQASKAAYLYNPDNGVFITYNDRTTMMYTTAFVKSLDIAGVMNWEISADRNKTLSTQLWKDLPYGGRINTDALAAPQQLALVSAGTDAIQVKWNASAGATAYEIYVNRQYAGTTANKEFKITSLTPDTTYKIEVLAIEKNEAGIQRVSINSDAINEKTAAEGSGNTPIYSGGYIPAPTLGKDELEAVTTRDGKKLILKISSAASVKTIKDSKSTTFDLNVKEEADPIEIVVPKDVIAALADKGDKAILNIHANGVVYGIPAASLPLDADLRVLIQKPESSVSEQINSLLNAKSLSEKVKSFIFKLEKLNVDGTWTEIKGKGYPAITRSYTFDAKDIDPKRVTAVVYGEGINDLRSVLTQFRTNADGKVIVTFHQAGSQVYTIVESNYSYRDAKSWAQQDIALAAARLIAVADSKDNFGANRDISRAEIVSIIVRGLGIVPDGTTTSFNDVDAKSRYAADIAAAKQAGLILGKSAETFDPNGTVTRQELAVMLANAMKYAGKTGSTDAKVLSAFQDQKSISSFATSSLALMVDQKIMQGVSNKLLAPQGTVTKAQATVTVMRMLRSLGLSQ